MDRPPVTEVNSTNDEVFALMHTEKSFARLFRDDGPLTTLLHQRVDVFRIHRLLMEMVAAAAALSSCVARDSQTCFFLAKASETILQENQSTAETKGVIEEHME